MLNSCYKFEGDQTIPSYIRIDSVSLITDYYDEGSSSEGITDAWIYVDDALIGAFELPATVPVLANGIHKLEIRPGIKLNGISSTRAPYPFYKPITFTNFNFVPDSVLTVGNPTTEYYSNTEFAWLEDFENSSITIVENLGSDTVIKRTQPAGNPEAFSYDNSKYSGVVNLTTEKPVWTALSYNQFQNQPQGSLVLLELDFKTDNYVSIGVVVLENSAYVKVPLLTLNHAEEWTKIYVNLGPNLSLHPGANIYQVFFESALEEGKSDASIYLDNIKLVYRTN
ncbi:MAG TPA: hypothetical protein VIN10_12725 [Bacteroidales bacterium]